MQVLIRNKGDVFMGNIIMNKNVRLNKFTTNYSIPKNMNFKKLSEDMIVDLRSDKKFSLDSISKTNNEDLTVLLQPTFENEMNLETNMFSPYPVNNIPFSYSNSWIGM